MARRKLPDLSLNGGGVSVPDARHDPDSVEGVLIRRIVAHLIDSLIVYSIAAAVVFALVLMNIMTLGLFAAPMVGLGLIVPIFYFSVFTGGPQSATPGMRAMRLRLTTLANSPPGYVTAAFRALLYYASMTVLSPLVLVVAFFNARRRTLHDILSGTVVVNQLAAAPV